jgi:U3 small nucleolar ribonucleoprotein protein LCP5
LEKIRPIDYKLRYQIDKLVKTAITGATNSSDPLKFKANPSNLMSQFNDSEDESSESESDEDGSHERRKMSKKKKNRDVDIDNNDENVAKYVPPKLTSMPYEDDESVAEKQRQRARKRAINSALVDEWKEEFLDTPIEIAGSSRAQQMVSREMKERERFEEENYLRLPTTKADKHRQKRLSTMGMLGDEITGSFGGSSKKRKGAGKKKSGKRRKFH